MSIVIALVRMPFLLEVGRKGGERTARQAEGKARASRCGRRDRVPLSSPGPRTALALALTGATATDQWPGSRVIAAQKANTANAFSLPHLALSTANLYAATQPGGTLFGLQEANPTNDEVAYGGDAANYGTPRDFMVGKRIGGTNVFGGGLPLYDDHGKLVGGLGVSGDASCADHNIAWKMRYNLGLDHVPTGVADGGKADHSIYDITNGVSASGFGHPECSAAATSIGKALPTTHPIGH